MESKEIKLKELIKNPTSGKYNYYDYNSIEDYLLKINKIEKQC